MSTLLLATGALATLLVALPAWAEPPGPPAARAPLEEPAGDRLDLSLSLGPHGFRLGGRLFGPGGYAGEAWLSGRTRPDGFSLDGRLEHGGRTHHFEFNADLDGWARRAAGVTDL